MKAARFIAESLQLKKFKSEIKSKHQKSKVKNSKKILGENL